jgi:NAD(P)-dependent dehydrogenase (short-subunit alcohol dehydrogenase family)
VTDFAGLKAVVTGGASGIGLAAASLLAARGAEVVVFDLKPDVPAATTVRSATRWRQRPSGWAASTSW